MSTGEFLVEIGCEELPAEWLDPLIGGFARQLEAGLEGAGIRRGAVRALGSPRRLVGHAASVKARQTDRTRTEVGPPARVGRTPAGEWTRAALGFAARLGLRGAAAEDTLTVVETKRGAYVAVEVEIPGRPARELLPEVLEAALRGLSFPKPMTWDASIGGEPFPFGRPIRWIVALFDGETIPFRIEVAGGEPVVAGGRSRGHRFRSRSGEPGQPFAVDSFASLRDGLRERFVILDPEERRTKLGAALVAAAPGLAAFETPFMHHHLVEWPGAVLGRYSEEFRALPEEIRRAVLVQHQKYLPVADQCAFLAVVNMPDDPAGAIRRGAERVVRARLRDAAFFWDEALRRPLGKRRRELAKVTFHRRIGHLRDHSVRVARLARWTAERVGADPGAAEEAAALARCDLTTGLVGEFPSLQGEAGGRILEAQGEREAVWRAVRDHYRPVGQGGELPATVEGAVLALADRASTLAGLFAASGAPSGSGDPFGLRRAALSMLSILREAPAAFSDHRRGWPTPLELVDRALAEPDYDLPQPDGGAPLRERLMEFVADRLFHALSSGGMPAGVVRAVLAVCGVGHPVADSWRRVLALRDAVETGGYAALAAAAKRARRILTPETRGTEPDRGLLVEEAEVALFDGLRAAERQVAELSAAGRYREAFGRIAGLSPKVDAFFDEVLVMAEDPAVRRNRLALLVRLDTLFRQVGDLGRLGSSLPGR